MPEAMWKLVSRDLFRKSYHHYAELLGKGKGFGENPITCAKYLKIQFGLHCSICLIVTLFNGHVYPVPNIAPGS